NALAAVAACLNRPLIGTIGASEDRLIATGPRLARACRGLRAVGPRTAICPIGSSASRSGPATVRSAGDPWEGPHRPTSNGLATDYREAARASRCARGSGRGVYSTHKARAKVAAGCPAGPGSAHRSPYL